MKKIIASLVCLLSIFALTTIVNAKEKGDKDTTETKKTKIVVYEFSKNGCPHCTDAAEFFKELLKDEEYKEMFDFKEVEVFDANWNADSEKYTIMESAAKIYGDDPNSEQFGTPYIIAGDKSYIGFTSTYEDQIKESIKEAYESDTYKDKIAEFFVEKDNTASTIVLISVLAIIVVGGSALVFWSRKSSK